MRILELFEWDIIHLTPKAREVYTNRKLKEAGFDLDRPIERKKDDYAFKWVFRQETENEEKDK